MNQGKLMELGFTRNEATVYLALAKQGTASAQDLIAVTKMHKKIVYENLEKLITRGLVSFVVEKNRRIFSLAPPSMLVEEIDQKMDALHQKKEEATQLAKELEKIEAKAFQQQEAIVFRGKQGIYAFYHHVKREDYAVMGAPKKSLEVMGEHFWRNQTLKLKEKGVKGRLLFNESLRDYGESIREKHMQVKFLEEAFEPLTETIIQKSLVAIIVWTDEPFLFLIKDKEVAKSYLQFFEKLWKGARK